MIRRRRIDADQKRSASGPRLGCRARCDGRAGCMAARLGTSRSHQPGERWMYHTGLTCRVC
jgi:hypothetical protein